MDPNTQMPSQNSQPTPSAPIGSGSNWQEQAVAAARASMHPPQSQPQAYTQPNMDDTADMSSVASGSRMPDWQQGLVGIRPAPTPIGQQAQQMPAATVMPPAPQQPAAGPVPSPESVQPFIADGMPEQTSPLVNTNGGSTIKKLLIIGGIVVLLIGAGIGVYMLLFAGRKASVNKATQDSKNAASVNAIDVDTLQSAAFQLADTTGYTKDAAHSTATNITYTLDANKRCSIGLGTLAASQLPGNTVEQVVGSQVDTLKNGGATVSGPTAGDALVLHDTKDGSKTYKLATLNFVMSKATVHLISHYSLAITKNGDRAVVVRVCYSDDGQPVPGSVMAPLETTAKQLTVTPGT